MLATTQINQLVDRLFRCEAGKIIAVLTRIFGSENIELAEDVVQDALIEAVSNWQYKGIPDNPSAWLFRVAKNKALNIVNREKYQKQYASDTAKLLRSEWTAEPALEHLFSEHEIIDGQLRMIFTCCHPAISADSQVALALKTLCGFSIPEIAKAFLTTEENISKRLVRARQKIRTDKIPFEVPVADELQKRLDAVLETIYLLFNEGYSASTGDNVVRFEICDETIRLAEIVAAHQAIKDKTPVYALLALMQLNAARFAARQDSEGNLRTMAQQDRSLWNRQLIAQGISNLAKIKPGGRVHAYQVLAAISACHCLAEDFESTDWKSILALYDSLVQIDNSPVVQLNRAVALSKVNGPGDALQALQLIKNESSIKSYYLFYSAEADFFIQLRQYQNAVQSLEKAICITSLPAEKELLQNRLNSCKEKISES